MGRAAALQQTLPVCSLRSADLPSEVKSGRLANHFVRHFRGHVLMSFVELITNMTMKM